MATDGVVRRRRNTWPGRQWSRWKSESFDVVEGSRRIYIHPMFGESGRGLSGANDDDSVLVAIVGWHGDGWWACCVGGAGRDLRHVGVRGGESVWGRAAGRALMLRSASSSVASWRSGMTRFSAAGVGRADGRGVVMICDEPLARRWWGKAHDWSGLVWCTSGLPAGISRCAGLLLVGWRAARLSRSCHIDSVNAPGLMMVLPVGHRW